MPWTSEHINWLIDTGERLTTVDGKTVEVWEFCHEEDDDVLSAWAKHFRNHYCLDDEIDFYRQGYSYSRSEYLNNIKFPDRSNGWGPRVRAGDFGEILVADYLQYVLQFWVPRTRYGDKATRNESTKGCDIIGFKVIGEEDSPEDTLAIFESKVQFSGTQPTPRLQDAVNGSAKDEVKKGEALNAIKQRLSDKGFRKDAKRVDRFQNSADRPHNEISGAVALFETSVFDRHDISETTTDAHPNSENLILLVIHGEQFMNLVHNLYRRAADEA
jgi:hypothetical protein